MSQNNQKLGLLPIGRSTFDVEYAQERLGSMLALLKATDYEIVGSESLLFDADACSKASDQIIAAQPGQILVLQVTFTDAGSIQELAGKTDLPLLIWSIPEPRAGDRLRLNSFCGLNLASHTLGLGNRPFGWLYCDPEKGNAADELSALLAGKRQTNPIEPAPADSAYAEYSKSIEEERKRAKTILGKLATKRIARIGEHPEGFSTCRYNAAQLQQSTGIQVDEYPINFLFDQARQVPAEKTSSLRESVNDDVAGLAEVDQSELDRSLNLAIALQELVGAKDVDAFALRCWPETFTEYGGAVCAAASMLGEKKIPCACEADVYGSVSQLLLQEISQQPVFLVDIVDVDVEDNSAVVWHCGQAPLSMRSPKVQARATIHTNRKMPLLYEFPLRAGKVTFMRWSQAQGTPQLMIGTADMLDKNMSYTGTSGVLGFADKQPARPQPEASRVLERIISSGLEHHVALVYGDYQQSLAAVALEAGLPVTRIN